MTPTNKFALELDIDTTPVISKIDLDNALICYWIVGGTCKCNTSCRIRPTKLRKEICDHPIVKPKLCESMRIQLQEEKAIELLETITSDINTVGNAFRSMT